MSNDILKKELIGCDIKIKDMAGKVIDETKNMLIVEMNGGGRKKFIKKNNLFEITNGGKTIKIDGKELMLRPEERIKIR
jgi:ribonuclease P protein subunit POP4